MSARRKAKVVVTQNFEANLARVERFLDQAQFGHRFDSLVDDLTERVVPLLQQTPRLGTPFAPASLSPEGQLLLGRITARLDGRELRQLVRSDFVVLYLFAPRAVYLLAIRHQREDSFYLAR